MPSGCRDDGRGGPEASEEATHGAPPPRPAFSRRPWSSPSPQPRPPAPQDQAFEVTGTFRGKRLGLQPLLPPRAAPQNGLRTLLSGPGPVHCLASPARAPAEPRAAGSAQRAFTSAPEAPRRQETGPPFASLPAGLLPAREGLPLPGLLASCPSWLRDLQPPPLPYRVGAILPSFPGCSLRCESQLLVPSSFWVVLLFSYLFVGIFTFISVWFCRTHSSYPFSRGSIPSALTAAWWGFFSSLCRGCSGARVALFSVESGFILTPLFFSLLVIFRFLALLSGTMAYVNFYIGAFFFY